VEAGGEEAVGPVEFDHFGFVADGGFSGGKAGHLNVVGVAGSEGFKVVCVVGFELALDDFGWRHASILCQNYGMKQWVQFVLLACALGARAETNSDQHFAAKVRPLLESRCVSCHGSEKVKGGLRLDSRAAVLMGGDSGPAVVAGNPKESLLLQAVMHAKPDLEMPPKEKLTVADVAVFEKWIRDGAPWPEENSKDRLKAELHAPYSAEKIGDAWHDSRNPIVRIFGGQRLDLWSLKPVRRLDPPQAKARRWIRNPIDNFVLTRLESAGLQPSFQADRRTLARRLFFDLTGLPPTAEEMENFLKDQRPDAYEQLVDDLLASPRYGEHQARLWLDVIRYSDSNGFDWDEFRPKAWRFRDYVIKSFNVDKGFDRFILEQLAGDELLAGEPACEQDQDLLVATGYLRLGPQDNSAGAFNEQDRARAELMSDLVETTGNAFLGLTIGCNRCHDHKYDPLSQADHYRMRAFFEAIKYGDDVPLDLSPEQAAIRKQNESVEAKIRLIAEGRASLLKAVKERIQREKKEVSDEEAKKTFTEDEKERYKELSDQIAAVEKEKRKFTTGLFAIDNAEKVAVTKVLFQGDHKNPRDAVEPGFISILDPNPAKIKKSLNPKSTGRRLTLAEWVASPDNPLTARVIVNRLWQAHFGQGLVGTPNDFGLAGSRPTHPELLDWLASEMIREKWSLKKMHRLIVTSATYRQASAAKPHSMAIDANNTLLWRQNTRRLSAEQLRDSLLAVSGLLREYKGGPPIWPELPPEVLQANPAFLDDNAEKTKGWYPSPKPEQNVRSVYLVQKRTVRIPFMETFDLPQNSVSCAARIKSTVPPQALTLLNGALTMEAADALAGNMCSCSGATEQVNTLFAAILQRSPTPRESASCEKFLDRHTPVELARALLNLNEFIYID
jgi:hypothetical protein